MATTPNLTTYEFNQVTVALGPILMDGFQNGEGVVIAHDAPRFTKVVGIDGKVTRNKSHNRMATVTIKLMQTSAQNDLLSALLNTDSEAPNGAGILPIYIRDRNGRSLHTGAEAWIEGFGDVTYDAEATAREWVIGVARLESFTGGN